MASPNDFNTGLTAERLRHLFDYDPDTGHFRWKQRRPGVTVGKIAGHVYRGGVGYIGITIDLREYVGHRLAWLYMTGEWPADEVDHINCVKSDNRWANLRAASTSDNGCNRRIPERDLPRGVHPQAGRFRARVMRHGRRTNIGTYDTPEEAAVAYQQAAERLHGDYKYAGRET